MKTEFTSLQRTMGLQRPPKNVLFMSKCGDKTSFPVVQCQKSKLGAGVGVSLVHGT